MPAFYWRSTRTEKNCHFSALSLILSKLFNIQFHGGKVEKSKKNLRS